MALHSLTLMARTNKMLNAHEIADMMSFSKNHLAKVMQVLVRYEYVSSIRGPKGGFFLKKKPQEISLLEIYEIFEGKLLVQNCALHSEHECPFKKCVFGGLTGKFTREFADYLKGKTLGDFV